MYFIFKIYSNQQKVAKETIQASHPHLNIFSHFKNIFDPECGVKFFVNFDVVFMALDNAEARAYVNSLCITLNIPMLEAGTNGFKG